MGGARAARDTHHLAARQDGYREPAYRVQLHVPARSTHPTDQATKMNRVAGKAALVTGGGAGIGAATGELICAQGGMALLIDANADALAATMQAIAERVPGAQAATFAADVANPKQAERAVAHALD